MSAPEGRRVALTGVNSYVGTGVIRRLLDDPAYELVVAVDIAPPSVESDRLKYYKVDLTLPNADRILAGILTKDRVTDFLHLAFISASPHQGALTHELEAIGTMHLLNACEATGIRKLVLRSTTALYGARPGNPAYLDEGREPDTATRSDFVADKIEVEKQLLKYQQNHPETVVTILRSCTSLGRHASNYISRMLQRRVVLTVAGFDPPMQFIHEDDLFDAWKLAVDRDFPGIFNICGPGVVHFSEVARMCGAARLPVPFSLLRPTMAAAWIFRMSGIPGSFVDYLKYAWVADCEKARQVMGFLAARTSRQAVEAFVRDRLGR